MEGLGNQVCDSWGLCDRAACKDSIGGADLGEVLGLELQITAAGRIRRDAEVVGDGRIRRDAEFVGDGQGAGGVRVERVGAFLRVGRDGGDLAR